MSRPDFAATFLQEAEDLLRQVEDAALALESSPGDVDLVNQLFRAFHTIKGSGGMFGFDAVVSFTHHVETALDHVREGRVGVSPALVSLVLAAKDHIQSLLGQSSAEPSSRDAEGERLAARFAALWGAPSAPGEASRPAHPSAPFAQAPRAEAPQAEPGGTETYNIFFELEPGALEIGVDPGCIVRELRELGVCTFHAGMENPPPVAELGPDPSLRWQLTLSTDKPLAAIRDVFIFVEDLAQIRIERVGSQSPTSLPPPPVVITSWAAESGPGAAPPADATPPTPPGAATPALKPWWAATVTPAQAPTIIGAASARPSIDSATARPMDPGAVTVSPQKRAAQQATVRVPSERLDQLVNLVGEMVINQSRLTQAFAAGGMGDMAGAVESMDRLIAELRDSVLGIRMMPIGSTFSRFQRLVRDLSTELGKEVDFVTEGAETELDKTVIDQLGDPLVHLIRNSLDHGIESPQERLDKGKPARGRLLLSASHEGAHVVIRIQDDGRGLNGPALRAKAEAKGLISPGVHLGEQETFDLVFMPGLSTAASVTNISGRGVGLDVVKRTIADLRGTITLSSELGKGITTRLTLPLTLAIVDGLLVELGADRFIIPMASVLENVELSRSERAAKNGRNLVNVRGELVPYVRLRELFDAPGPELDLEKVVIVAVNTQRLGLVVDHVLGSHQTVIQALGHFYRDADLFSGTTIMGDGRVAMIIDLAGVVRHTERAASQRALSGSLVQASSRRPLARAGALAGTPS